MANIFNIDWGNVGENLIPWFWRETDDGNEAKLVAYVRSMLAPIQTLGDRLDAFHSDTFNFLDYTGQHKVLEEYLNDTYDITLRRIFITENDIGALDPISIYLSGETTSEPLELYLSGESPPVPVGIYLSNEVLIDNNFTVNIPSSIVYNADTLNAQLRNYVEASKNYNIIIF